MSEEVIDLPEVMERVQDDKELLLELFEIFTKDYDQKIQVLRSALTEKNFEVIKDVVHSIKGAAGNISAKAVHATCLNIEKLSAEQNISAIESTVPVLDGNFKILQSRMAEIKKEFNS